MPRRTEGGWTLPLGMSFVHREGRGGRRGSQELRTRGADIGVEGVDDEEALQRHKKGLHQIGGSASPDAAQSDLH